MVKAGEIVGRPVVFREDGREAGRIRDLVVDRPGKKVLGFVISEGFLRATKVAPWGGLQVIGPDSVIFSSAADIVPAAEAPEIEDALDAGTSIRGLKLETTAGKELGRIEDFGFNEQTGEIEGYEISGGRLSDTLGGRTYLPAPSAIELGKDVAFVEPEAEATIRQISGGIKGVFTRPEE